MRTKKWTDGLRYRKSRLNVLALPRMLAFVLVPLTYSRTGFARLMVYTLFALSLTDCSSISPSALRLN
ncbi:hypothetical protein MUP05_07670, partial [Candidatus Bathyarchaeota archaeon]|nr:hypothetical protein [Candidatus Bathyarchaeota archaeon]